MEKEEIWSLFESCELQGRAAGITQLPGVVWKEPSGLNETESVILAFFDTFSMPGSEVVRRAWSLANALGFRTERRRSGSLPVKVLPEHTG